MQCVPNEWSSAPNTPLLSRYVTSYHILMCCQFYVSLFPNKLWQMNVRWYINSKSFNIFITIYLSVTWESFCKYLVSKNSTSIVGTDIRMSNLDIRVSSLDICMSTLDIRMSKVILEFGKNETAKNSRLNVAFRKFFQIFGRPTG